MGLTYMLDVTFEYPTFTWDLYVISSIQDTESQSTLLQEDIPQMLL